MTPKPINSLKALAEGKTDGFQKAAYFKVRPDVVELEPGFNLREEGAELTEHIERLYHAMKAGAYIPPIDVSVIDDTFGEKCVEFVRNLAGRSTLVTYQSRDFVNLIEDAYNIAVPEGTEK